MSSDTWSKQVRLGRLQFGYRIYRHKGVLPDRWVIQPFLIFDRAR